jgi:hypothetical protein
MKIAGLSTGRLGSQFANLASQIAHVHPIVGNLAGVLGNFAVGGLVTAGVLGGVALMAVAWDQFTESSRKAKEQTDKFIKALVEQARAARTASIEGLKFAELQADIELQKAKAATGIGARSVARAIATGKPGLAAEDASAAAQRIANAQTAVSQAYANTAKAVAIANEKIASSAESAANRAEAAANKLRIARERDAAEEAQLQKQISDLKLKIVLEELQKVAALHAEIASRIGFTGMPNISMPFEGLDKRQKEQLRQLGILTDETEKNTTVIRDAIWGSATQMANQIVSALNIGGGGKGSGLGGALGGTAGFALGFMAGGPIGGAIGSTIGNIAGSLFGGLFDSHKKEVNANTQALRALTAEIHNAPSGFKINQRRYDATDVKEMGRAVRSWASRGGANPLLVGT